MNRYKQNVIGSAFSHKPVVGLDRDGTIIEDLGKYLSWPSQVKMIDGSIEAIRTLRSLNYRVIILTNQAGISKGITTQQQVENVNAHMLQLFGQGGIQSIDGLYYSTTNLKEDEFAKPNVGMFKRAQAEIPGINWSSGWYVGDKITDLKAANKIGAIPVLVRTGHGKETEEKLDTFANRDLKKKTLVFDNLYQFVLSIV